MQWNRIASANNAIDGGQMDIDLTGKCALVTGGSRGIGRGIALAFGDHGASAVACYINETDAVRELGEELKKRGGGRVAQVDVTDEGSVKNVVAETVESYGKIDVVVNNAGLIRDRMLFNMSDDDWDAVLDTNLRGAFLCSKAVLRPMLRSGGRIVNVSSVVGQIGNAGQVNYASSKAALIGFTKSLALEIGSRNVTVNAVAPGFIQTAMTSALSDDARTKMEERIALRVHHLADASGVARHDRLAEHHGLDKRDAVGFVAGREAYDVRIGVQARQLPVGHGPHRQHDFGEPRSMADMLFEPGAEAGIGDRAGQHEVGLDAVLQQLAHGVEKRVNALTPFDPPHEQNVRGAGVAAGSVLSTGPVAVADPPADHRRRDRRQLVVADRLRQGRLRQAVQVSRARQGLAFEREALFNVFELLVGVVDLRQSSQRCHARDHRRKPVVQQANCALGAP